VDGESAGFTGGLTKTDQRRENIQRLKEDEDAEERRCLSSSYDCFTCRREEAS
jgi:hypothetical protein